MFRGWVWALSLPWVVAACGFVSEYEKQVYDWEPVYCYQSLGAVQCYEEPKHRDTRRLVNYYGPHPTRYDAPDAPERAEPQAPKPVGYWVKDEEPVPQSAADEQRKGKPALASGTL